MSRHSPSKSAAPPTFLSGLRHFWPTKKIFVFRDRDKGFAAASAVCTHLGCTVAHFSSDQKFHCPCHGSVFGPDGAVIHGPAPRPLNWFEVTLARDGQLSINKDKIVPSSYRLMV